MPSIQTHSHAGPSKTHGAAPAKANSTPAPHRTPVSEEIHSYIAIRDGLLNEAERKTTCEALCRATVANDMVERCLRPARSPYEAQCLDEGDAARERERCHAAKVRIAELGANNL